MTLIGWLNLTTLSISPSFHGIDSGSMIPTPCLMSVIEIGTCASAFEHWLRARPWRLPKTLKLKDMRIRRFGCLAP
jgi:hypothetical protein